MKPLARYASLNDYVELAHDLGLDPAMMVRQAGLDPASLSLQDRWVPASAIGHLLEDTARLSGRDDIGLALAQKRKLSNLGPLSLVIREEPDVRSALRVLMQHERLINEALRTRLTENAGIAFLKVSLDMGAPGTYRQSVDFAVGVLHSLLSGFLGPTWRPLAVALSRPTPPQRGSHLKILGPPVRFNEDFDGITMYSKDLDSPNVMSDQLLRPYAQRILTDLTTTAATTLLDRVRELIELLLPTGRCSADQVALSLGIDRRTVHRHLTESGYTFSSLLDETRLDLAGRLVQNPTHSFTEIAEILGFSSPASFSRWFRRHFDQSPRDWRRSTQTPVGNPRAKQSSNSKPD